MIKQQQQQRYNKKFTGTKFKHAFKCIWTAPQAFDFGDWVRVVMEKMHLK